MSASGFLPVLLLVGLALALAWAIDRLRPRPSDSGRFQTIDGLRGWLAFFVFIHHACIWYFYLRTDRWDVPPSRLYTHLGESSVALFFMITGFLFAGKLLRSRATGLDWLQLFVSRVMRLTPLYVLSIALMVLIVAWMSGGQWMDDPVRAVKAAMAWLLFSIPGHPDINGLPNTFTIVAGVTWSLRYEWLFYLVLPLAAVVMGARIELRWVVAGLAGCAFILYFWTPEFIRLLPFAGGVVAALLSLSPAFNRFAARPAVSVGVLALVALAVSAFPTVYQALPIVLLTMAFCLVANGNDLFGLLRARASLLIGDLSYGIYLMHGLVLYILFEIVIGRDVATSLSVAAHWGLMLLIAPVVIGLAYLAFHWVERPGIDATQGLVQQIRSRARLLRSARV